MSDFVSANPKLTTAKHRHLAANPKCLPALPKGGSAKPSQPAAKPIKGSAKADHLQDTHKILGIHNQSKQTTKTPPQMTIYYLASDVSLSLPDASSKRKHHLFVVRTVPQASGRPSNKPIKPILLVLLNLVITVQVSIAQITRNDVLPLFAKLGKENFKGAQQLSAELLKEFKKDTTSLVGIVRYAYLYSSAALVSKGEMSY